MSSNGRNVPTIIKIEKFLSNIAISIDTDCWNWIAHINLGYGIFGKYRAHRVSYSIFKGDIPTSFVVDHLCGNKACCNPDHLRAVEQRENIRHTLNTITVKNKMATHCPKGHEYTESNTYRCSKGRACFTCRRTNSRNFRLKKKKENDK